MPQKPDLAKRELWRKRLLDFERGNRTIVEFCRRTGVPVWSFYYWRHRLQGGTHTAPSPRRAKGTKASTRHDPFVPRARRVATKPRLNFVPIQVTALRSVEVHLPDGARVMVPCQERDAIAAVIAALVSESRHGREKADGTVTETLPSREDRPC